MESGPASATSLPVLAFSNAERAAGSPTPERVESAVALFAEHGALLLQDVYERDHIERLDRHYRSRYRVELAKPNQADRRRLFTVDVEGPFAETRYYANPLLFPILQRLLGADCILGSCSSVVSWPGAPAQTVHRDSESLYGDYAMDVRLPSYAVTVLMPLVRADARTGSTRVWPGTHRVADFEIARAMPSIAHEVEPGSALITDSRVLHAGEPNRSDVIRPLLYNAYHRAWFRDLGGYELRPPVNVGWRGRLALDRAHRHMFRIAEEGSTGFRARWILRRGAARWIPRPLHALAAHLRRDGGGS
jgi:phytanoyl-CoA dioxygenase PhyH